MKALLWFIVAATIFVGLMALGPRAPVDRSIAFNPSQLPADLDNYLADAESGVADLRDGVARRIVWNGTAGEKTPLSVVYLHGFSATSEEIRPVPDRVADALGANLHFARLAGHGRSGDAMAEPVAGDWIEDTAEALAIGRRIGDRVLVIATSTGGTLAALAATDPQLSRDLAGVVLVSPNFQVNRPDQWALNLPLARLWLPWIAGERRGFTPANEDQGLFWTADYPTKAVVPMAALVEHVRGLDFSRAKTPALFLYSEADQVVAPAATARVFADWGGPKKTVKLVMGPGDDPGSHVIAGDIMSPGQTEAAVQAILAWIEEV